MFSVSVWFPNGATRFQPYLSCCSPLTEPCLRYLRTRLLTRPFTLKGSALSVNAKQFCFHRLSVSGHGPCFPASLGHCVASFPPMALPILIGTMRRSDSPELMSPSSLISVVRTLSPFRKAALGSPGLPRIRLVVHAMVSDPGEVSVSRPFRLHSCWLPRTEARRPSHLSLISRLNPFNLSAYGLHACCPTLKVEDCSSPSKDLLPGGWPALPGRDSHPLEYATLPGRTQLVDTRRLSSSNQLRMTWIWVDSSSACLIIRNHPSESTS